MEKTDDEQDNAMQDTINERLVRLEIAHCKDIELLKREMALLFDSKELALKVQTKELERRLYDLNGEAARLKSMQISYLPREKFEDYVIRVDSDINELKAFKSQIKGTLTGISIMVSLITAIIVTLVQYLIAK